jgi:hypothetical protein
MAQAGPTGLADFAGCWRVLRRIDDRHARMRGRFDGQADFVPDGQGLTCTETGLLRYGDAAPLEGTRRNLWRPQPPHAIAVHFADGRFFHAFDLAADARAAHDCAPDLYRVRYDFSDWPAWRATWTVSGPRKDYTSETTYTRKATRVGVA